MNWPAIVNILNKHGINKPGDLQDYRRVDIERLPFIGKKKMEAIDSYMAKRKMKFKGIKTDPGDEYVRAIKRYLKEHEDELKEILNGQR